MSDHTNSFSIKEKTYKYYDLKSLDSEKVDRLPFTHKILLENALRHAENDHEGPVSYTHLTLPTTPYV